MSRRAIPRWIAQRATVRIRLTVMYSLLLLSCGGLLLAVTYTLVQHNISGRTTTTPQTALELNVFKECKLLAYAHKPGTSKPTPGATSDSGCKKVFASTAQAGAAAQRANTLHHLLRDWLGALAVLTVLSAVLGWWLSGRALRPIAAITTAAQRAAGGDLSGRLALTGPPDELHLLAATFDQMLERLQAVFESQRQFIANASHELRTPLTVMRTAIEVTLAKPNPTPHDTAAMTTDIQRAIARSEELVNALVALARSEQSSLRREPTDLATLVEDALDDAASAIKEKRVTFEHDLEPAPVRGDPVLIGQMIANLIANAIQHNEPHGWARVVTATDQSGSASITVENSGPNIPTELAPQLFEPFKRLQRRTHDGGGLGLGLAIAHAVVHSHGGTIEATPRDHGGLTIKARLPERPAESALPGKPLTQT